MNKNILIMGLMLVLMATLVSAFGSYTSTTTFNFVDNELKLNDSFKNSDGNFTELQLQAMEQITTMTREQLKLNCTNCSYELVEVRNKYSYQFQNYELTEVKQAKFLGLNVDMKEIYILNEEGVVQDQHKNLFSFLYKYGLVKEA